MNIYFGRINPEFKDQLENAYYEAEKGWKGFCGLSTGDYVYMLSGGNVHLWKTLEYDNDLGRQKFEPIISNLAKETSFLTHFKYLELSVDLAVKTMRHVRSQGFFKVNYSSEFTEIMLCDKSTYENPESFRNIFIMNEKPNEVTYDLRLYFEEGKLKLFGIKNADASYYASFQDNLAMMGKGQSKKDKVYKIVNDEKNRNLAFDYKSELNVTRIYDAFMVDYKEKPIDDFPCKFWSGGHKWGDDEMLHVFRQGNYWQNGWSRENTKDGAVKSWTNFNKITVGDFLCIHGYGGNDDLIIYSVAKIVGKDDVAGRLELEYKSDASYVYKGKGTELKLDKGGWRDGTLFQVTGKKTIERIFGKYIDFEDEGVEKKKNEKLIALLTANHNIILHGAPGTGKTYLAKEIAKEMGAEYDIVQFHQSYDYTDFVEGLRPAKGENNKAEGFERKDGVFKAFCKNALEIVDNGDLNQYSDADTEKMVEWFKEKAKSAEVEIKSIRSEAKFTVKSFDGTLKIVTSNEKQIQPYYAAIKRYLKTKVYNHSNMTYTPAIGQYILDNYPQKNDLKPKIIQAKDAKFVFIIDEINRGEMSKIFGELFYSIDPGYRGENGRINTQYQNLVGEDDVFADGFFVPENVYIIGTMNDIDRSVESMDFAMRRRFAFKEVTAEESMSMFDKTESWKNAKGELIDVSSELAHIKNRMLNLNDEILKEEFNLGSSYQIGAAYFLKFAKYFDGANATSAFNNLWDYHLEGVLREYLRGMSDVDGLLKKLKTAYDVQDYVLKEKKSESTEG